MMNLAFGFVAILCCFSSIQEPQTDRATLVAERKKQIEEFNKQREERIERARQGTVSNPESAEAHFELAEALSKGTITIEIYKQMEQEYSKAIQLKPNYPEAFLGLAGPATGVFSKKARIIEAIEKALSLKPDYAEAYCALGSFHLGTILNEDPGVDLQRQAQLAVDAFAKAIQIKSDTPQAHMGLGFSYYYLGRREDSLEAFKQAVALYPNDLLSHNVLGKLFADAGDEQSAMQEYEALMKLDERLGIDMEARGEHMSGTLAGSYAEDLLKKIKKRFDKK